MWPPGTGPVTFLVPSYQSPAGPGFYYYYIHKTVLARVAANALAELARRAQWGRGAVGSPASPPQQDPPRTRGRLLRG